MPKGEKCVILWAVSSCGLRRGLIKETFALLRHLERVGAEGRNPGGRTHGD
jgi:hypothetical protein